VDVLAYQKNWAGVIAQAEKGYPYYPLRKDFLFHMGSAYLETGNLDASIEATKEFLETHPYYLTAHHNIGLAYARGGDMDPALEHFDRVFQLVPEYGESHYVVAQIYELRNEQDKALLHYRLAVEDDGDNAKYRERLARLERLIEDGQTQ
jgi:tetratricopeptide (TPR) repeat protein